jgi:hypothetical protein
VRRTYNELMLRLARARRPAGGAPICGPPRYRVDRRGSRRRRAGRPSRRRRRSRPAGAPRYRRREHCAARRPGKGLCGVGAGDLAARPLRSLSALAAGRTWTRRLEYVRRRKHTMARRADGSIGINEPVDAGLDIAAVDRISVCQFASRGGGSVLHHTAPQ